MNMEHRRLSLPASSFFVFLAFLFHCNPAEAEPAAVTEATRRIAEIFTNSEERVCVQIVQASSAVKKLFANTPWPAIRRSAGNDISLENLTTPFPEYDYIRLYDPKNKGKGRSGFSYHLQKWRIPVSTNVVQEGAIAYIQFLGRKVSMPDEDESEYVAMAGMRIEPHCSFDDFVSRTNVPAASALGLGLAAFRARQPSTDRLRLECIDLYYDDFSVEWREPLEPGIIVDILVSQIEKDGRLSYLIGRFHVPVVVAKPSALKDTYKLGSIQYIGGGTASNVTRPYVSDGLVFGRRDLRWDAQKLRALPIWPLRDGDKSRPSPTKDGKE